MTIIGAINSQCDFSESLQQKLNIEQSAHSMVPAGCLVVVVGYVCSYSLELLSPTL